MSYNPKDYMLLNAIVELRESVELFGDKKGRKHMTHASSMQTNIGICSYDYKRIEIRMRDLLIKNPNADIRVTLTKDEAEDLISRLQVLLKEKK